MTAPITTKKPAGVILLLLIIAVAGTAGCTAGGLFSHTGILYPRIVPNTSAPAVHNPSYSFPFEDGTVNVSIPVNNSVYAGAQAADKDVIIYGNVSEATWTAESYMAMVNDPSQEEFYTSLLSQFRTLRATRSLDDNEYPELITVFVQSLHYETVAENPPKFPIETFVEGSGDCDDKSLLLAGLLSREGYRVALFSFTPESHMAVGISSPAAAFKNSSYAYIETTNLSFICIVPAHLGEGIAISSDPLVIPIGNGTRPYTACDQTFAINTAYITSVTSTASMVPALEDLDRGLKEKHSRIDAMTRDLQILSQRGTIREYNAQVLSYNSLVAEYNTQRDQYTTSVAKYRSYASIHDYILNHGYDRKGTYTWVVQHPLP
ncbi:MAG: hypothetical protein NTY71_05580 [Methanoregula sp.]|nr:hypothetical protein [Methanoregula sp.]